MTERYQQIGMDQYLSRLDRIDVGARAVGPKLSKQLEGKKEVVDSIVKNIAFDYNLEPEDLYGSSRKNDIVQARHVAAYFLHIHTELSLRGIALSLGRNDHTTIINAINNVEELIKSNPEFRERIKNHPLYPESLDSSA